jgi:fatty-acyl-CoA synthase
MRLVDYLDKGRQLGADAPCLTMDGRDLSYGEVQRLTYRLARGLLCVGVKPDDKVAVLSSNDSIAFACVFGISRAGAIWCPINPRNEAAENRFILDAFDCSVLFFHSNYAPLVEKIRDELPSSPCWCALTGIHLWRLGWSSGSKASTTPPWKSPPPATSP